MQKQRKNNAAFIRSNGSGDNYEICNSMKNCYPTCQKCMEKWLETKRK